MVFLRLLLLLVVGCLPTIVTVVSGGKTTAPAPPPNTCTDPPEPGHSDSIVQVIYQCALPVPVIIYIIIIIIIIMFCAFKNLRFLEKAQIPEKRSYTSNKNILTKMQEI